MASIIQEKKSASKNLHSRFGKSRISSCSLAENGFCAGEDSPRFISAMSVSRLLFMDGLDGSITVTLASPEGRIVRGSSSSWIIMGSTGAIKGLLEGISNKVEDDDSTSALGIDFVETSRKPIESRAW